MVQPVRVIKITSDRLVSGEFRDEGMLTLLTQWRDAPIKVEEQLLKRQTWQANVNSGLIRPTPAPAYRPSVGMCMSGCAPTGARTSYHSMVRWTDFSIVIEYWHTTGAYPAFTSISCL